MYTGDTAGFLTALPPSGRRLAFSIEKPDIHLQHDTPQRRAGQPAPQAVVPFAEVAIVRTDPNTNGTIGILARPELETLLSPGCPFENALQVGNAVGMS
jgi:hypothetical protein